MVKKISLENDVSPGTGEITKMDISYDGHVTFLSIMSLSRPFDFIKDLNDSKHLWKIAVRITQIWYVQIPSKLGHLEMILMDSKGDKIQVSVKRMNLISGVNEITCVTVGTTTMFVVGRQGWYYDGCNMCTKKTDVKDGPFTCKCGHFNQNPLQGEDDPKAFPLVLDELLARTMVLRVKVQPSYNQSSVIRLYEDPNLIKKVLDQIGVFESVSITADHDPEQFQVVTPAKRLSAEFYLDLLQISVLEFSLERELALLDEEGSPGRVKSWVIRKDSRLSESWLD
ncbi:hypothetical protein Lal_00018052 [Lupinus albus]|nr:hypothetical protein Lal_00018052 [Lupinus albus]